MSSQAASFKPHPHSRQLCTRAPVCACVRGLRLDGMLPCDHTQACHPCGARTNGCVSESNTLCAHSAGCHACPCTKWRTAGDATTTNAWVAMLGTHTFPRNAAGETLGGTGRRQRARALPTLENKHALVLHTPSAHIHAAQHGSGLWLILHVASSRSRSSAQHERATIP